MDLSKKRILYSAVPPLLLTLILWTIAILEWGLGLEWGEAGILPRSAEGIKGIFLSAFIHKDFYHLLANTPALFILGWFLYYFYRDIATPVFLFLWLTSGLFTWATGRPAFHIGASGLIYGLAFFLFFSGVFRRNTRLAALALIMVFLYGNLVWNMFPVAELNDPGVSWEGHLSGALAGLLGALMFRKKGPQPDPEPFEDETEEDDTAETTYQQTAAEEDITLTHQPEAPAEKKAEM